MISVPKNLTEMESAGLGAKTAPETSGLMPAQAPSSNNALAGIQSRILEREEAVDFLDACRDYEKQALGLKEDLIRARGKEAIGKNSVTKRMHTGLGQLKNRFEERFGDRKKLKEAFLTRADGLNQGFLSSVGRHEAIQWHQENQRGADEDIALAQDRLRDAARDGRSLDTTDASIRFSRLGLAARFPGADNQARLLEAEQSLRETYLDALAEFHPGQVEDVLENWRESLPPETSRALLEKAGKNLSRQRIEDASRDLMGKYQDSPENAVKALSRSENLLEWGLSREEGEVVAEKITEFHAESAQKKRQRETKAREDRSRLLAESLLNGRLLEAGNILRDDRDILPLARQKLASAIREPGDWKPDRTLHSQVLGMIRSGLVKDLSFLLPLLGNGLDKPAFQETMAALDSERDNASPGRNYFNLAVQRFKDPEIKIPGAIRMDDLLMDLSGRMSKAGLTSADPEVLELGKKIVEDFPGTGDKPTVSHNLDKNDGRTSMPGEGFNSSEVTQTEFGKKREVIDKSSGNEIPSGYSAENESDPTTVRLRA